MDALATTDVRPARLTESAAADARRPPVAVPAAGGAVCRRRRRHADGLGPRHPRTTLPHHRCHHSLLNGDYLPVINRKQAILL